ncbi:MAG: hypothetical protein K0Q83_3007 [Deltaproteobacteria bacterium]|nr:hypothetical protein [Deltaproteobacteria bacterium]
MLFVAGVWVSLKKPAYRRHASVVVIGAVLVLYGIVPALFKVRAAR